jgi:cation diffusion facilitator family transporter
VSDDGRGGNGLLPERLHPLMKHARRLAALMIAYLVVDIVVLYLLWNGSQSIFALIVADVPELVAPVAFLASSAVLGKRPTLSYPFGYHRAITLGAFASSVALLALGLLILLLATLSLLQQSRPTIPPLDIAGEQVWLGWVLLAYLVVGTLVPLLLGRAMLKPARPLNNKVLYDAARTLSADWQSTLAAMGGILGVAVGLWWLDVAAAAGIALSIIRDGVRNTRRTGGAMMDRMPTKVGSSDLIDLVRRIEEVAEQASWTGDCEVRLREVGDLYVGEVLVEARNNRVDIEQIDQLTSRIHDLDWTLQEVLVVTVRPTTGTGGDQVTRIAHRRDG